MFATQAKHSKHSTRWLSDAEALFAHARGIVLSWAVLGQRGPQHVNCHSNECSRHTARTRGQQTGSADSPLTCRAPRRGTDVIDLFTRLGYTHDAALSAAFRTGLRGELNRSASRDWLQLREARRQRAVRPHLRWQYKWFARSLMVFVRRTAA